MKKILILSITLILLAGVINLAIAVDIDTTTYSRPTGYAKDRHIVKTGDGQIVVLYQGGSSPAGIRARKSNDNGATWTNLSGGSGSTQVALSDTTSFSICLGPSDEIYVTYYEEYSGICFKKLTYSGGNWSLGAQKSVDNQGSNPSIIYDGEESRIWIAYVQDTGSQRYMRAAYSSPDDEFDPGYVSITTVATLSGTLYQYFPALVLYNDGGYALPFLIYQDAYDGTMKYSPWQWNEWATPATIPYVTPTGSGDFSATYNVPSDIIHLAYRHSGAGIKYTERIDGTTWMTTPKTLSTGAYASYDMNPSLTTNETYLWCFASIYYDTTYSNIKYKKIQYGNCAQNWTAITNDTDKKHLYSTTPSGSVDMEVVPLAWTYGTSAPYTVKFDTSVTTGDTIAPAAITTLAGTCNLFAKVKLTWNAPGDDGMDFPLTSGSKYRIDYSSDSNQQWDKDTFDVEISTSGVTPGSQVSYTTVVLQEPTTWYFRIWTRDETTYNWSGLSNGCTVWVETTSRYWVGATNPDNWNDANNWAYTSGGTGGAGVPGTYHTAIFDGENTDSCLIDIYATIYSVIIYSTYTATVSIDSEKSLTTSRSFNIAGGTFTTNGELLDVGSYSQTGGIFNANTSSVTCSGNFSISAGTFNAGTSALILDGSSAQILTSNGRSFYDLKLAGSGAVSIADDLSVNHNFTNTTHTGSFDANARNVTIGNDFQFDTGILYLGEGNTWTVAGDWDTSSVGGIYYQTSTVDLTGTGELLCLPYNIFYKLKAAASGETTTLKYDVVVSSTLTLGTGTLTDGVNDYFMALTANSGTPLINSGAKITLDTFRYIDVAGGGTVTIAGGKYGTLNYLELYGFVSTFNFAGDIEVNGTFRLFQDWSGGSTTCNTQDNKLTATGLYFGDATDYRPTTFNCGASTITIGTGGLTVATNGGSHTLNLSSATVTCAGNWKLVNGSGSIAQVPGISTVAFDNATSTSTLTGSTTFYVLISTTTGKTVKVSSDTVINVTNHLNFENITLRSTLDGATWYLNLNPSATQDVSNVDVRDSNASGGETIVAVNSTNSGNNTNWEFGDITAPAAITDLTGLCDTQTGDVTLSWSTPGDDDWNNPLDEGSKYIIDYSSYSIQWSTATFDVEISTSGVDPHTQVSHTITGLTGDTTWYFQIWTADEVPNWSGLSNGATVWVNPILSVSISTDTYAFGTIECATSTVSGSTINVTNEGNVTETYSIMCSSTTKWTPQNTPGPNQFTLQSAFHPTEPTDNDLTWKTDDILTDSLKDCTTAVFSIDGTEHGKEVLPFNNNDRKLWFRLKTPLSTSTTDQQTITITISAQSP